MAKISIRKEAIDPFLNNVSLLLPFDGSFDDASNNDFAVTANGNVQISSAQSKFGGASAYFDGSGDYIEAPVNAGEFGSGDFTIECWINADTTSSVDTVISKGILSTLDDRPWTLEWSGGRLAFFGYGEVSTGIVRTNNVLNTGTWYHIAVVKQGSTFKMFLDGIEQTNHYGNPTTSTLNAGGQLFVGTGFFDLVNRSFHGYIDDLRITKGVARYTANFTPPDKLPIKSGKLNIERAGVDPFFNNVSLLLPMNTSFADFSSNNFALTANGNVQISNVQSKFGGGSAFFDGDGDYLDLPVNAIQFNADDFTIEFWVYPTRTGSNTCVANWGCGGNMTIFLAVDIPGGVVVYLNGTGPYITGGSIELNQWQHVALVRQGSNMRAYINGVQAGGTYNIGNTAINTIVDNIRIGRDTASFNCNTPLEGYMGDLRITTGVARYTGNFTPPNSPFSTGKGGKVNISKLII